jgi:PAS domain S-box-containing protein
MIRTRTDSFATLDIDRARCPMFVVDAAGTVLRANRRAAQILGRRKSELRGKALCEVLKSPERACLSLDSGKTSPRLNAGGTRGILLPSSGNAVQVDVSIQAVDEHKDGRVLILAREMGVDCGSMQATGTHLHVVAEAQERERRRIARELHDEALQSLLVAGIEVERLMQCAKSEEGLPAESLLNLRCLLRQVETDVRQISGRMRSDTVPQCGLLDAVGNAVQTLQARGIDSQLRFRGTPVPVDPNIQILAYRIAQEALHNAWRHSGARHVRTTVTCRNGQLTLRVTDDGCGFAVPDDFTACGATEFLGIKGMFERASLMNATLSIASRPSRGTSVSLCIPIVSQV